MATSTDPTASHATPEGHEVIGADDPNVWGWHHTFGKGARAAGWIVALILLAMTIGNHEGRVEDLWLVGIAAIMIATLIRDIGKRRRSWRS